MALRKPLVIGSTGKPQQLQAGDTLDATQSGGDAIVLTNDEATPVVICAPVYIDANAGFKKAQANAAATAKVTGLVAKSPSIAASGTGPVQTSGPITATTGEWDAVTGQSGGLTFDADYFLDPATAGKLTTTPPTTVGQLITKIGVAISATILNVSIETEILL